MSAASFGLGVRRRSVGRLHLAAMRVTRQPGLALVLAAVGLLGTFGSMLAVGSAGRIGAISLVPWVALIAVERGPLGGVAGGTLATALYVTAAEAVGGPEDAVALALRVAALIGVGLGAGLSSRRIAADARELEARSAAQRVLLDSTVDGICFTDLDGNVLLANAPLQRFALELGLPPHGTVTERLLALADRTTEPVRFRERMTALACDVEPSEDEFELAASGRVFRGYTAPVAGSGATAAGRIWTLRDVTADRRLERLRDAFLGAVSHELRTPLTSISGFLEMLADEEPALGPAARTYVTAIRRGADRLQRIVEDLLLVAQIEARRLELRPAPTDLAALVVAAVEAWRPAATAKEIELASHLDGELRVEADAERVAQVLDNLVSNAIKFTPRGGSVTVSAHGDGDTATIEIADTGIGVPQDEVGQLFSRFFRASTATRRAIPGTGLGLVIARAIVEGHGGSIVLESREGRGTRVAASLPARQPRGGT